MRESGGKGEIQTSAAGCRSARFAGLGDFACSALAAGCQELGVLNWSMQHPTLSVE